MSDEQLEIQKRLTLNWLIQGASQHAGLTLHYLVREELNALDQRLVPRVIERADRLEFEPWLLQSGGELWRRLLAAVPENCSMPHVLMRLARLPAEALQSVISDVIEDSKAASPRLASLVQRGDVGPSC